MSNSPTIKLSSMASPQPAAASPTAIATTSAATIVTDRPNKQDLQPVQVKISSPRFPPSPTTPTFGAATSPSSRRIGIAVDLSDESAYAVKWAVDNYLRRGDTVMLIHVRSTSILYGADWGSSTPTNTGSNNPFSKQSPEVMEEQYDNFTSEKANRLSQPLVDAHVPVKIHIVKDHDMKERLCLEVERLGLNAVIMGSRGIGASRKSYKGKLGTVSDYCVQHCACPVVVVRYNQEDNAKEKEDEAEEQNEFHDAEDHQK